MFAKASHIVGGTINYRFIGNNQYLITFKIYRDCNGTAKFDGDSSAATFTPFYFGIFEDRIDGNIFLESERQLLIKSKSTIQPPIANSCLIPNGSCVEEGIYETIITLPRSDIGYTIIHQRCCRNDNILNVEDMPGTTDKPGITLKCYIPPTNLYFNHSAVFKKYPPIFICKNQAFYFDHSAYDPNGDVLRYYLATPISGLTSSYPTSSNQTLSDNQPITWATPYSLDNVLGGIPPLTIDSLTGFLSCKPNANGRFVVSIMVVEKRNDTAIDTVMRDFQFNVVDCDIPKADMPFQNGTYDPNTGIGDYLYTFCDTFFVRFKNTSTNASIYRWDFGDPVSGVANYSTLFEPTHTYSDTGVYFVKLYAYKVKSVGDTCKDSTFRYVRVFPKFIVNFTLDTAACPDSIIQFTDRTTSYYGITQKWRWDFGDGKTSTVINPKHSYTNSGIYSVRLTATDSKKCIDDTSYSVVIHQKPLFLSSLPKFCVGVPLQINCGLNIPNPDTIKYIRWTYLGKDSIQCSFWHMMSDTTPIPVSLYCKTDKGCEFSKNYILQTYPTPQPPVLTDSNFIYCNQTFLAKIEDLNAIDYLWNDGSRDSIRSLSKYDLYKFTITYPCSIYSDSFVVYGNTLKANFDFTNKCQGEYILLSNTSENKLSPTVSYLWTIERSTFDVTHVNYPFAEDSVYMVQLVAKDVYNCIDSIVKAVQPFSQPKIIADFPKLCVDVPTVLSPQYIIDSPYRIEFIEWQDSFAKLSNNPRYTCLAQNTNTIWLKLIVASDKGCIDSIWKPIYVHPTPHPFNTPDSFFIHCADTVKMNIYDSLALDYTWRDYSKDSIRSLDYPGVFYYTISYPCMVYSDSFKIHNSCTVVVPNAFTPNGDGYNDVLYIRGYNIKKLLSFKVFNRQGQLLFFSHDVEHGWDGYYKDVAQSTDTYFYTYEVETYRGTNIIRGEGQVLLLK